MGQITEHEEHVIALPGNERRLVFVARVKAVTASDYIQLTQSALYGSHSGQVTGSSLSGFSTRAATGSEKFYLTGEETATFRSGYLFYTPGNDDRLDIGQYLGSTIVIAALGRRR